MSHQGWVKPELMTDNSEGLQLASQGIIGPLYNPACRLARGEASPGTKSRSTGRELSFQSSGLEIYEID